MVSSGWVCPKCGRVYSNLITECSVCNTEVGVKESNIKKCTCMSNVCGHLSEESLEEKVRKVGTKIEDFWNSTLDEVLEKRGKKNKLMIENSDAAANEKISSTETQMTENNGVAADDVKTPVMVVRINGKDVLIPEELLEKFEEFYQFIVDFIWTTCFDRFYIKNKSKQYDKYIKISKLITKIFTNVAATRRAGAFIDDFMKYGELLKENDDLDMIDETLDAFENFFKKIIDVYIDEFIDEK